MNDYPKLCKDCKYSRLKKNGLHNRNLCVHPIIIRTSPAGLADNNEEYEYGASCLKEREKISWFAKCGIKGKLFEPRVFNPTTSSTNIPMTTLDEELAKNPSSSEQLLRKWKAKYSSDKTLNKGEQKMIEMRWLTQAGTDEKPKLQYRTVKNYLEMGLHPPIWTEWEDVQTYIKMDPVTSGSGGGSYREYSAQGVSSAGLLGGISQAGLLKKPDTDNKL